MTELHLSKTGVTARWYAQQRQAILSPKIQRPHPADLGYYRLLARIFAGKMTPKERRWINQVLSEKDRAVE